MRMSNKSVVLMCRSFFVFANLGLLCTCHGDGSVEVARLPTPQIRIPNLSGSQQVTAEDQIYPFVPRTISECLHPSGLRFSVGGNDCLFTISNSGRILYWPKEKLEASLKILRQSSLRLPVEVHQHAHLHISALCMMPIVWKSIYIWSCLNSLPRLINPMSITTDCGFQAVNESVMVVEYDQITEGACIWEGDFATVSTFHMSCAYPEHIVVLQAPATSFWGCFCFDLCM